MLLLETVYANSICPKDQTLLWGNMVSICLTSLKNSTTDFLSTRLLLTTNMTLIHTSFTYSKLNMDKICGLKFYLSFVHQSQKVLLKSLHAQRR